MGPTERDQDEGQGQGPASSRAEKMKNEEIKHTTRQPRACEPNRRHGGARRRGGSTSTRRRTRPQQGRQDRGTAELKLLQFPRPVSGRRSDTNFNKTSTTKAASSTLPQYQVLRYPNIKIQNVWARHQACQSDDLNLRGLETIVHKHYIILHYTISPINVTYIKFYATSTKTQNAGGEEEDASESRHGGENEDENNKDKSFKKTDSTRQPKNITTISHGSCVPCDAKVSKTNTMKK